MDTVRKVPGKSQNCVCKSSGKYLESMNLNESSGDFGIQVCKCTEISPDKSLFTWICMYVNIQNKLWSVKKEILSGDDYGLVRFNLLLYIVLRSETSSRFRECM